MSGLATRLVCAGCGTRPPESAVTPFRCDRAHPGDAIDHVITRRILPFTVRFPTSDDPDPFVRYRTLQHTYHVAMAGGMSDAEYVGLVRGLEDQVAFVDGHAFRVTPFAEHPELARALSLPPAATVWIKDETGNVSGSHKARHLMGILLFLRVQEHLGRLRERPPLAIASCGNAALAAAVLARAAEWPLRVFIPTDANPAVVARLQDLHADVAVCPREPGVAGDPCYHAFQAALRDGALPFCCQGPDNGLTIEGGETLAYELVTELAAARQTLDHLFVQVGGGALASATIAGLREAAALEVLDRMPRVHTVQTQGAWPLARAYAKVVDRIREALHTDDPTAIADAVTTLEVRQPLRHAITHRGEYMWPWEDVPHSVAHGILDDETYDWHAVVRGMIETGGRPLVVSEEELTRANELAATTGIPADPTGSSGLAGLLRLASEGGIAEGERVAVLFTGARR